MVAQEPLELSVQVRILAPQAFLLELEFEGSADSVWTEPLPIRSRAATETIPRSGERRGRILATEAGYPALLGGRGKCRST